MNIFPHSILKVFFFFRYMRIIRFKKTIQSICIQLGHFNGRALATLHPPPVTLCEAGRRHARLQAQTCTRLFCIVFIYIFCARTYYLGTYYFTFHLIRFAKTFLMKIDLLVDDKMASEHFLSRSLRILCLNVRKISIFLRRIINKMVFY